MPDHPDDDLVPPLKVMRKRLNGVYRADSGFSGPTRRYVLIVALLVGLASVPTLAAITAGSHELAGGKPDTIDIPFLPPASPGPVQGVPGQPSDSGPTPPEPSGSPDLPPAAGAAAQGAEAAIRAGRLIGTVGDRQNRPSGTRSAGAPSAHRDEAASGGSDRGSSGSGGAPAGSPPDDSPSGWPPVGSDQDDPGFRRWHRRPDFPSLPGFPTHPGFPSVPGFPDLPGTDLPDPEPTQPGDDHPTRPGSGDDHSGWPGPGDDHSGWPGPGRRAGEPGRGGGGYPGQGPDGPDGPPAWRDRPACHERGKCGARPWHHHRPDFSGHRHCDSRPGDNHLATRPRRLQQILRSIVSHRSSDRSQHSRRSAVSERPQNIRAASILERSYASPGYNSRRLIHQTRGEDSPFINRAYRGSHRAVGQHHADERASAEQRDSRVGRHHAEQHDDYINRR